MNEFWIANLTRLCPASWLKRHRVALHRQSVLAMISHKVVSSFVAGLLLGGVIAVYGLRSFLFKQHNLMERRFFGSWSSGAIPVRPVLIQKFEPGTANNMTLPLVNPKSSLRSCTQRMLPWPRCYTDPSFSAFGGHRTWKVAGLSQWWILATVHFNHRWRGKGPSWSTFEHIRTVCCLHPGTCQIFHLQTFK